MLNASVITAVTKCSVKPRNGPTANRHLRSSEWRTKVSFGTTMLRALELQWLAKGHISG